MKAGVSSVFGGIILGWLCLTIGPPAAAQAPEPALIESVKVLGNDYIPAEGILDEVKEILQPGQAFTPERARAAQEAVSKMGYFEDVQITSEPGTRGIVVVIRVVEKPRIQKILFVGNTVLDDTTLLDAIFTRVGHVIDDRAIRRDVRRIEEAYAQRGYIARVTQSPVSEHGVLTFVIEEARLEDIVIEGLKKTKPFVVRRELTLKPGELYREKAVARDLQKIFNLGIFEKVSADIRPGVKDPQRGIILVIKVEEKRTGQLSLAAGYSNLDNFVMILSYAEQNFRGRAERIGLSAEMFGRTSYDFSFYEPYLDERGTAASLHLYDTERHRRYLPGATLFGATEDRFQEHRVGGTLALSRPLSPTSRASVRFRSEKVYSAYYHATRLLSPEPLGPQQVFHVPGEDQEIVPPGNPDNLPEEAEPGESLGPVIVAAPLHPGGTLTSIQLGWTRDTRDQFLNPTSGQYTGLTLEQAGSFLGGSVTFSKILGEHRFYYKLDRKRRDVIAVRLMAGTTFGYTPFFETFSVGGANTLRGYEEDRFRGKQLLLLNCEYRRPLGQSLSIVGFVDVGDAFGGEFRTSVPGFVVPADDRTFRAHVGVGIGLRVLTPIGPIRLDFGWGEEGNQAHFSFGHTF